MKVTSKNEAYAQLSEGMQAFDDGYRVGAAAALGVILGFMELRDRLWQCEQCYALDDPRAACRGQNFVPDDLEGPWICWMCGVDETGPR